MLSRKSSVLKNQLANNFGSNSNQNSTIIDEILSQI